MQEGVEIKIKIRIKIKRGTQKSEMHPLAGREKKGVDGGTVCAYLWCVMMNLNLRLLLNALLLRRAAVEV